jgi:hypothetical protein
MPMSSPMMTTMFGFGCAAVRREPVSNVRVLAVRGGR